jgi:hypothetical protein
MILQAKADSDMLLRSREGKMKIPDRTGSFFGRLKDYLL